MGGFRTRWTRIRGPFFSTTVGNPAGAKNNGKKGVKNSISQKLSSLGVIEGVSDLLNMNSRSVFLYPNWKHIYQKWHQILHQIWYQIWYHISQIYIRICTRFLTNSGILTSDLTSDPMSDLASIWGKKIFSENENNYFSN